MNVRIRKQDSASYLYYDGVTAKRAAELAVANLAATCVRGVRWLEVREDISLFDPPVLVTDAEGNKITDVCEFALLVS